MPTDGLVIVTLELIERLTEDNKVLQNTARLQALSITECERQKRELVTAVKRGYPVVWRLARLLARFVK